MKRNKLATRIKKYGNEAELGVLSCMYESVPFALKELDGTSYQRYVVGGERCTRNVARCLKNENNSFYGFSWGFLPNVPGVS